MLPVTTTASIFSSAWNSCSASPTSLISRSHNAFSALGRLSWIRPTLAVEPAQGKRKHFQHERCFQVTPLTHFSSSLCINKLVLYSSAGGQWVGQAASNHAHTSNGYVSHNTLHIFISCSNSTTQNCPAYDQKMNKFMVDHRISLPLTHDSLQWVYRQHSTMELYTYMECIVCPLLVHVLNTQHTLKRWLPQKQVKFGQGWVKTWVGVAIAKLRCKWWVWLVEAITKLRCKISYGSSEGEDCA